ncbi:hypothetical protein D9600_15140 [Deinococcus sp. DB0503]|nr:hypothetical protein [Deinococcus sp. DB0503]
MTSCVYYWSTHLGGAFALLQLDDLRRLRTPAHLADLYHLLGYPADLEAEAYSPQEIGYETAAWKSVSRVWLLVNLGDEPQTLQHIHIETEDLSAAHLRTIADFLAKTTGEYLLTFATPAFDRVVLVKPRREGEAGKGTLKLGRLSLQPSRPTQHDLSVLREIAVDHHAAPQQAHQKQIKAFNVERVTRRFFDEYKKLFHHVRDTIAAENRNAQIGPLARNTTADQTSLHAFTQRLLGRIIFLYFIQKKGWLDKNPDFLTDLYQKATAHAGGNFYRDALEPLFFEVLNTERGGNVSPFGDIPYLNGSLFEREYPQDTLLNLPNSLFDPKVGGSVLNVLGGYNFTVSESSSLEQEISLDPEMLGKVFENMMEEEEAAQSGTFYTPRSIVQFMAEETLTRYLSDQTGIPQDRLLPLVTDDSEVHDLTTAEATQIITALGKVRVLDPAVGTASMLVGFLNAMIRVRRSAEAKRGLQVSEGSPALAQWKREYIQHCLYGVDIKQEAIEIARLRLWLSLVVDAQEAEPLPNLDYKLMAGDGLLETVDGTPFIKVEQAFVGDEAAIARKAAEIEVKHEQFFSEQRPPQRRALRAEIQQLERELFKADVDYRIKGLDGQIRLLDNQISDPRQSERSKNTLAKRRTALAENMGRLLQQKVKVWDEKEPLPFFLHNVHFAEVMKDENREGNGGFDIVIGNPPYVRHERLGKEYKAALGGAFPDVSTGTADLYVYFYQKGLNLLRGGGRLAFITPNKFMRAGYGEKLRGVLSAQNRVEMLADFGDLPVFDATTYPLIALIAKAKPAGQTVQMLPERTLKAHLGQAIEGGVPAVREALASFHQYARSLMAPLKAGELSAKEWTLDDPRVLRLMEKLRAAGRPLGEVVDGKFYRGIVTGYNEAFVIGEKERTDLIAADPRSEEVIKPFLRGRDVQRWRAEWAGKYIIFTRRGIDIDKYPAIKRHLEKFRDRLTPGVKGGRKAGSYKWYEIQDNIAYYEEFYETKIVYNKFQVSPKFAFDGVGCFTNDAVYIIGNDYSYLLPILNSPVGWFCITQLCYFIQGGYQLIADNFGQLPIPTPTPEQARRLESFTDDSRLAELNALVYELYGLNAGEIALVRN